MAYFNLKTENKRLCTALLKLQAHVPMCSRMVIMGKEEPWRKGDACTRVPCRCSRQVLSLGHQGGPRVAAASVDGFAGPESGAWGVKETLSRSCWQFQLWEELSLQPEPSNGDMDRVLWQ